MNLLKIKVSGFTLLDNPFEIDFNATQRVSVDNAEKLTLLFSKSTKKFYINNVISFIGINASGKTTILKLISFVCKYLRNESINNVSCNEILDNIDNNEGMTLDVFFYSHDYIYFLHSTIIKNNKKYVIKDEIIKRKSVSKIQNKTDIFNFDNSEIVIIRNNNEVFLLDDVSVMVAINKQEKTKIEIIDMLQYTNINQLKLSNDCPLELIEFFDPTVHYLHVENRETETKICLKFKDKKEIILNQFSELNRYLSSGTIKGINTFLNAIKTFKTGGYLIIDELENHFNHEIVSTLIRFYYDKKINIGGAVLIFSTHYSEILDEIDRNDNIYIVRNRNGITTENLSSILDRNDIKKSEAYDSGLLEGTTPMYDAYYNLKKSIINSFKGEL